MSLSLAIALYIVIWWVTLFAVLPIGLRTQEDEGEIVPGTPESAPGTPRLLRVALINTGVATVVFAVVYAAIVFNWVPMDRVKLPGAG